MSTLLLVLNKFPLLFPLPISSLRFALEKCSQMLTATTLPDPIPAEDVNVDNLLAGHFGVGEPRILGEARRDMKIETPTEAESLQTSLLRCLKSSIHTPKRNVDDLRFGEELENASSRTSLASVNQQNVQHGSHY